MMWNPFRLNKNILSENLQEEFLEMKCNFAAKNNFEAMSLTDFWGKYVHIYKNAGALAIRTIVHSLPFHRHTCAKVAFLLGIKTKYRNKFDCEADLKYVICYKVTN